MKWYPRKGEARRAGGSKGERWARIILDTLHAYRVWDVERARGMRRVMIRVVARRG